MARPFGNYSPPKAVDVPTIELLTTVLDPPPLTLPICSAALFRLATVWDSAVT